MRELLQLEQGSDEWVDIRRSHITSTDVACLIGANPWPPRTMNQLYWKKHGPDNFAPTEAMRWGIDSEPKARAWYNEHTGHMMEPVVFRKIIKGIPFMASLDGYESVWLRSTDAETGEQEEVESIAEFKCPFKGMDSRLWDGLPEIPLYYQTQMEVQCRVTGVDYCDFVVWTPSRSKIIEYNRNDALWEQIWDMSSVFYGYMVQGKEPPLSDKDFVKKRDPKWNHTASELAKVRKAMRTLQEVEKELKQALVKLADDQNCEGNGIRLQKVYRSGIDMKRIGEELDLNEYRKEPTVSYRVSELTTVDNAKEKTHG